MSGLFYFWVMEQIFEIFYQTSGICTDTRNITPDSLFICIKGANFDGNTFASQALEQGAKHVIVDNPEVYNENKAMTLVENSVEFLQKLANYHRRKFDIPVIGITGSNGKTSTKELIHAVLSEKYNVLATIGNLNNHLGVPFTLLRMTAEHEIAIIEMGANRFKDIEELCAIAEPNYGIITNIGKAHLEGFKSFEGVLKTKRELYEAVEKVNGTLILNQDDTILTEAAPKNVKWLTYGTDDISNVQGTLLGLSPFVQMKWKTDRYESVNLNMQMIGKYNFYNYLAAITFGTCFDVPAEDISNALENYTPTNNRSQVKKTANNTLILDCYNANPTSMKSALESFALNSSPEKLLIIGDMKELGDDTEAEHKKIIDSLTDLSLKAITVGDSFKQFSNEQTVEQFSSTEEVIASLKEKPIQGHLILLKGSRSIGLEKLERLL